MWDPAEWGWSEQGQLRPGLHLFMDRGRTFVSQEHPYSSILRETRSIKLTHAFDFNSKFSVLTTERQLLRLRISAAYTTIGTWVILLTLHCELASQLWGFYMLLVLEYDWRRAKFTLGLNFNKHAHSHGQQQNETMKQSHHLQHFLRVPLMSPPCPIYYTSYLETLGQFSIPVVLLCFPECHFHGITEQITFKSGYYHLAQH